MEENNRPVVQRDIENTRPVKKDTIISWKQILLIVLLIFIVIFMMFNFNEVEVNLLFAKIQAPLVVVIFLSYILGSLITWLMHALKRDRN